MSRPGRRSATSSSLWCRHVSALARPPAVFPQVSLAIGSPHQREQLHLSGTPVPSTRQHIVWPNASQPATGAAPGRAAGDTPDRAAR